VSRIGKQPVQIPKGVTVGITGRTFSVKSSKGELKVPVSPEVEVTVDGSAVLVKPLQGG